MPPTELTNPTPFQNVILSSSFMSITQEIAATRAENKEAFEKAGRCAETMAKENYELRQAKERLEKMQVDGFLNFTKEVDPTNFKIFCTILAEGTVAKACRKLKIPDSTLRGKVEAWKSGGKALAKLHDPSISLSGMFPKSC
jgi:hypothetical protein